LAYENRPSRFERPPFLIAWRILVVLLILLPSYGVIIAVFGLAIYGAFHLVHGMAPTTLIISAAVLILGCLLSIVRAILNLIFWPAFFGLIIFGAFHLFHGLMSTPLIILAAVLLIFVSLCFMILGI
jgi:hypothetical protein